MIIRLIIRPHPKAPHERAHPRKAGNANQ